MSMEWGALAVQDVIKDRLSAASPALRIAWDGYGGPAYEPPALDPEAPEDSVWVRPSSVYHEDAVMYGGGWTMSLGRGILAIQVFGPAGVTEGPDEITPAAADTVAALFRFQNIDDIEFGEASQTQHNEKDSIWNQIVLMIKFTTNLRRPA
jgi:hypothetical protein